MAVSFLFPSNIEIKLSTGGMYGYYGKFNSFVDYESSWLNFYNDSCAKFLKDNGLLKDFSSSGGKFKKLNISLPVNLRVFIRRRKFTFFFEGSYIKASTTNNPNFKYNFTFSDGSSSVQTYSYSPLKLGSTVYSLGGGISKPLLKKGKFKLIGEISAGALFLNFTYKNDLTGKTQIGNYWLQSQYRTEMKGRGTGFYGYAALEVPVITRGRFSLGLRGGYLYGKVPSISGDSSYAYSVSDSTGYSYSMGKRWSGKWFIKEVNDEEWWGKVDFKFPSNYEDDLGGNIKKAGDFSPGVSGPFFTLTLNFDL